MASNFESGMLYKKAAWHGLGNVVQTKVYSSREAIELAGLNWEVSKRPCYINVEAVQVEVPGKKIIVRDSDNRILGDCSNRYQPLQNAEAFSFFDPYLAERDCFISTAGSLGMGKKVFITAEIESSTQEVVEGDLVKRYLLLATSHDGSTGITVKFVDERVVCENTLNVALAEQGAYRAIRHSANVQQELALIHSSLDLYQRSFTSDISVYRELAAREMTTVNFRSYLEQLFVKDIADASERLQRPAGIEDARSSRKCLNNWESTPDLQLKGVEGTAWAAYNAVTQFIQHQRSNDTDSRMSSIWFGADKDVLTKAKLLALTT